MKKLFATSTLFGTFISGINLYNSQSNESKLKYDKNNNTFNIISRCVNKGIIYAATFPISPFYVAYDVMIKQNVDFFGNYNKHFIPFSKYGPIEKIEVDINFKEKNVPSCTLKIKDDTKELLKIQIK